MMTAEYDLAIVGGGLTGAALAHALANTGLRMAVIDAKQPTTLFENNPRDTRSIAISYISQQILMNLGLWDALTEYATRIQSIHISNQGHFGFSRIHAQQERVEALGYVVEFDALNNVLNQAMLSHPSISVLAPAQVNAVAKQADYMQLELQMAEEKKLIQAKLVVAADGGHSKVRQLLGMKVYKKSYQQSAIACNIGLTRDHDQMAYERFTSSGPIAMLPLGQARYALVWSLEPEQAKAVLALSDDEFLKQLQNEFGYRLGRFAWCGARQAFPLSLSYTKQLYRDNVILIGNACHSLHPVAGQGFNLGLRDVAVLAEMLEQAHAQGESISQSALFQKYQQARLHDQHSMIRITDNLVKVFSNEVRPITWLRNLALLGLDGMPHLKSQFTRRMMGFANPLPELVYRAI